MSSSQKKICVTVDDLPGASLPEKMAEDAGSILDVNRKIVETFEAYNCPAIGFVTPENQDILGIPVVTRELLREVLEIWFQAGLELGNHSFTHPRIDEVGAASYIGEIRTTHEVLKPIFEEYGQKLEYYRHPYLRTGHSREAKQDVELCLKELGYKTAPVTMYAEDWAFAHAFAVAQNSKDKGEMESIRKRYLDFTEESIDFAEQLSDQLFGRQIAHTLVVHDNYFASLYLGELLDLFTSRGYTFISLEEALQDEAYLREDPYVGTYGPGWLERWCLGTDIGEVQWPAVPEDLAAVVEQQFAS